jgi:hypothetical protein
MLMLLLIAISIVLEAILQLIAWIILLIIGFFVVWGVSAFTAQTCRSIYDYIEGKCS